MSTRLLSTHLHLPRFVLLISSPLVIFLHFFSHCPALCPCLLDSSPSSEFALADARQKPEQSRSVGSGQREGRGAGGGHCMCNESSFPSCPLCPRHLLCCSCGRIACRTTCCPHSPGGSGTHGRAPPQGRCHPRWGTGSGDGNQEREKEAHRACVRERGIYILALQHGGAGARLAPSAGPPLAGLGRVLGASGPPLCGAPGSPGQVVTVPGGSRGAAAAALGGGTSRPRRLPRLLPLRGDAHRWVAASTPAEGGL